MLLLLILLYLFDILLLLHLMLFNLHLYLRLILLLHLGHLVPNLLDLFTLLFQRSLHLFPYFLLHFIHLPFLLLLLHRFFLLYVIYLVLQHFDMQLQLLFHFDMVPHLRFVLLQLLFILLRRQVQRLGRWRLRRVQLTRLVAFQVLKQSLLSRVSLIVIQFHLHQYLYRRFDVV